jgi:hypothetical protein
MSHYVLSLRGLPPSLLPSLCSELFCVRCVLERNEQNSRFTCQVLVQTPPPPPLPNVIYICWVILEMETRGLTYGHLFRAHIRSGFLVRVLSVCSVVSTATGNGQPQAVGTGASGPGGSALTPQVPHGHSHLLGVAGSGTDARPLEASKARLGNSIYQQQRERTVQTRDRLFICCFEHTKKFYEESLKCETDCSWPV